MAESKEQSANNPTSDELLKALEKAHLAGDSKAAREFAQWHQELYAPEPEPEEPGLIKKGMNALGDLADNAGIQPQNPDADLNLPTPDGSNAPSNRANRLETITVTPNDPPAAPPPEARRSPAPEVDSTISERVAPSNRPSDRQPPQTPETTDFSVDDLPTPDGSNAPSNRASRLEPNRRRDDGVTEESNYDTFTEATGKAVGNVNERFQQAYAGLAQMLAEDMSESRQRRIAETSAKLGISEDDYKLLAWAGQNEIIDPKAPVNDETINEIKDKAIQSLGPDELRELADAGVINPQDLQEHARRIAENAQANMERPNAEPGSIASYTSQAIGSVAEMTPALIAGALTRNPNVTMGMIGTQVTGQKYLEGREEGLDPQEARQFAIANAAAEAIPEYIPLARLFKQGSSFFRRMFDTSVANAIQEPVTELLQIGLETELLDKDMTWGEARERLTTAGIVGGLSGVGMTAVSEPALMARRAYEQRQQPDGDAFGPEFGQFFGDDFGRPQPDGPQPGPQPGPETQTPGAQPGPEPQIDGPQPGPATQTPGAPQGGQTPQPGDTPATPRPQPGAEAGAPPALPNQQPSQQPDIEIGARRSMGDLVREKLMERGAIMPEKAQTAPVPPREEEPEPTPEQQTRNILGGVQNGETVRMRDLGFEQDGTALTIDKINDDGSADVTLADGGKRKLSLKGLQRRGQDSQDGVIADPVPAENNEMDTTGFPEGFEPTVVNIQNRGEMYEVPDRSDGTGGNTLHETLEEARQQAQRNVEFQRQQDERTAETVRQVEEQQAQERATQAETQEIADTLGIPKVRAGQARATLNKEVSVNGEAITRKALIERSVADNGVIEGTGKDRELVFGDNNGLTQSDITKTGMDYAEALVRERGETSVDDVRAAAEDALPTDRDIDTAANGANTEGDSNESGTLEGSSGQSLEGVSTDSVQGTEEVGRSGRGTGRGGRSNVSRDDGAGERGVQPEGSVRDGEGEVSVPTGGTRSDEGVGADEGRGSDDGRAEVEERDSGDAEPVTRGDEEVQSAQESAAEAAETPQGELTQGATTSDDLPAPMFTITGELGKGGAKTKFKANLKAIETLKAIESDGRQPTLAEQETLAQYVGFGGIPQAFEGDNGKVAKNWTKEVKQLKDALTEEEYEAARRSTQDAHYTSTDIVKAMWGAMEQFGFRGGRVLEPAVGTGNFLGLMPGTPRGKSEITAVELDSITGAIARNLYPAANVQAPMGFQNFTAPDGYFKAVIGNPPFGNQKLYDKKRRHLNNFSIHNYFFGKSIDLLEPNGVLAMVVSSRLLDAGRSNARDYLTERAEFMGAIRLPNNAFLANAGTEVTTDLVFMRKLKEGEAPTGESWSSVQDVTDANGKTVPLNEYFVRNPQMMLGEWGAYGSMYGPDEPALVAKDGQDTNALLKEAIASLPRDVMDAAGATMPDPAPDLATSVENVKVQSMFIEDGQIKMRLEDHLGKPQAKVVEFNNKRAPERVRGMIEVRDVAANLRKAQLSENATDDALQVLRDKLNTAYDKFVKANGPINLDANKRLFRDDPTWPQLSALEEKFDKGRSAAVAKRTGEQARKPSAEKAAIFRKRTQQPYQAPQHASTAKDALAASLAEKNGVDLPYMAELYGRTEEQITQELAGQIFEESPGQWTERDAFLSGNVKHKLSLAKDLAKQDSRFQQNVDALEAVQPEDVEAVDISVKVGSHWLPNDVASQFAQEITGDPNAKASYAPPTGKWEISARGSASQEQQYGTNRVKAAKILESAANQTAITVRDKLDNDTTVVNQAETAAAAQRVEMVNNEFQRWIWSDDERRRKLTRTYNDLVNTDQLRQFDGSHLSLPGKVSDDIINLRPHQKDGIWRIVQSRNTLLDHVVGAGKTFTMVGAAMEMRRVGRARKPMFVVPNHLVEQWASDFLELYPSANILATTKKDFEKNNRKRLFARISTGDWDAVIVGHSSIGKVEMDPAFEENFIREQIRDITEARKAVEQEQGKKSRSVKQIEKQKDKLEEKLRRLLDSGAKDNSLNFAELGVDALFLDEAHEFKNLGFTTGLQNVAGLGNPQGSQKASDMFLKISYVQRQTGGNTVFATGTPISNTMAEMFTLQRYLDYDALKAQGLAHFDAWARMFGSIEQDWEMSASGTYKLKTRFAKFVNMPELLQRYLSFSDVITRDDIKRQLAAQGKRLPIPQVTGGKPNNVVVERSDDQAEYIGVAKTDEQGNEVYDRGTLIFRAENIPKRPEKGDDNMLKIMSDARKAALDMRLIDASYPDNPNSKIHNAADRIKDLYTRWDADKGTQLVFIDLSTPKGAAAKEAARIRDLVNRAEEGDDTAQEQLDRMSPDELSVLDSGDFSVYDDLKQKLIDRGVPEKEIAFIHEANTETQKAELFAKVRTGTIRVLFGSTPKMGAGMNVQERLVALHHMDAPWRPSDLEQREGRIIRQGNMLFERDPDNFTVDVLRYATKQTLDSSMWQTIEKKANFIEQVRQGNTTQREVEDVSGESGNAAEMKAASSGNPLILEEMDLRQQVRKLAQQEDDHRRTQFRAKDKIKRLETENDRLGQRVKRLTEDAKTAGAIPEKGFAVTVNGTKYTKQKEAGQAILSQAATMGQKGVDTQKVGSYHAFPLRLDNISGAQFVLTAEGESQHQIEINNIGTADPTGLMQRLKNMVSSIPQAAEQAHAQLKHNQAEVPKLQEQIGEFPKMEELERLRARHALVLESLKGNDQQKNENDVSSMAAPHDEPMDQWQPTYGMMGVNPRRPENNQFKLGEKIVKLKPVGKPTRREGIRVMVIDIIGPRLYQGKVKGKSRLGFYRESNSEVRIANFDDVEIMAHEMAHYLDMHYDQKQRFTREYRKPGFREEVQALSYTSREKLKTKEGFAEFVRLWLTQYNEAKSRAPLFTERFEKVLAQDKALNKKMTRLQAEMHRWYQQGDLAKFYAKTSGNQYTTQQQVTLTLAHRPTQLLRQRYVDKIHAAKVMGRTFNAGMRDASEDAYKQLQLLNGIEGTASAMFQQGAPFYKDDGTIDFQGPSLSDVWGKALRSGEQMVRDQELYFAARRAQELKAQNRENLITDGEMAEGLAMGKKYPHFVEAFDTYQEYRRNMMEFYVESGYVTREAADSMMERNQNYVPFHRVVESVNNEYTGGSGFQRLKGGTQNIKPIYDNMMMQEHRHLYAALKARAMRSLYEQALQDQNGSLFISKIQPDSKPVRSTIDQMADKTASAMADLGITIAEDGQMTGDGETVVDKDAIQDYYEQNPEELMFWTFGHKPKTLETMVDTFIDSNGKRVWVEIQKENRILADMIDNMDYVAMPDGAFGTAIKASMKVKNFQTLTITSMMQFLGPNIVRDTQQAFILSGGTFRPVYDSLIGLGSYFNGLISNKSAFSEMKAQGGPVGGRVRTFYNDNWGLASDVPYSSRKPFYHPVTWAHSMLDVYMAIADSPEMATRLGFYKRLRGKGVSAPEAAWQAREISTDFRKHGSYAAFVLFQRTIPFMGAYVQSVDRDIRGLAENKGEMKLSNLVKTESGRARLGDIKTRLWLAGSSMIVAHMLLALLNEDEERYQALTPDQKVRFYHLFIGDQHYTIPKPHGFITLMAQAAEQAVDNMGRQDNDDAWRNLSFAVSYHFGADVAPGIINPLAEMQLNRTFTGAPVVNRAAKDRDPQYQYDDRTPRLYVNAGRELGISPDKAHHLVRGYTGYLSDFVDEVSENMLWDDQAFGERPFQRDFTAMLGKQFNPRDVPYRTKWTTQYYELKQRAEAARANLSFLQGSESLRDPERLQEFAGDKANAVMVQIDRAFNRIDQAFSDQDEIIASIKYNPDLSAKEKESQIEDYYRQKNKILKDFYQAVEQDVERIEDELPANAGQ